MLMKFTIILFNLFADWTRRIIIVVIEIRYDRYGNLNNTRR